MGFMGIAVKVLIGLVLLLPMTAYVVGSLVAAAVEPPQHDPIIIQEQKQPASNPGQSSSPKHTHKHHHQPSDDKTDRGDDQGRGSDDDQTVDPPIVTPSPEIFDDHVGGDSSGKGSGDDSSGKGSGHG